MRRAFAAAVALLCLVGCTDDPADPTRTTTSSPTETSTTSQPPTTTGTPTDAPPELPDAAKAKTTAGAKAFVRHYVDVLNYSWRFLDGRPLAEVSAADCEPCRLIVKKIQQTAQNGGSQEGGFWTIKKIYALPGSTRATKSFLAVIHI
ncbi:MAG TPA: DUF6318 family protein, partial [Nocardioidaceae bacterium]